MRPHFSLALYPPFLSVFQLDRRKEGRKEGKKEERKERRERKKRRRERGMEGRKERRRIFLIKKIDEPVL